VARLKREYDAALAELTGRGALKTV
jgi:hypothetical protein